MPAELASALDEICHQGCLPALHAAAAEDEMFCSPCMIAGCVLPGHRNSAFLLKKPCIAAITVATLLTLTPSAPLFRSASPLRGCRGPGVPMRIRLLCVLVLVCFACTLTCGAAVTSSGPQKAWNVFTLPNPQVTPEWRTYAPADCQTNPDACAQDNRF